MQLSSIMTPDPIVVAPDNSVHHALGILLRHGFRHLLVTEERSLVGVVSDRDLFRNLSPFIDKLAERTRDRATLKRRIHQIMSRHPVTASPDIDTRDAAQLMLKNAVSCLPIVENGRLVGIVTSRDLLASTVSRSFPAA